jgi:hypothetical protein
LFARRGAKRDHATEFRAFADPADARRRGGEASDLGSDRVRPNLLALFTQFRDPPERTLLQDDYLRHYYRFADYAFSCWRDISKPVMLPQEQFPFTLYASGEYTKMLEEQWDTKQS